MSTEDTAVQPPPAPFVTSLTVGTHDLRRALLAVLPHADDEPDNVSTHRVRLDVGPEHLTIYATNRFTAAVALVEIVEHHEPELAPLDVLPSDVKKILGLFKPGKTADLDPQFLLRLESSSTHLRLTDVSGLIDGEGLVLLRTPTEDDLFPDIPAVVRRLLPTAGTEVPQVMVAGPYLALWAKSAAAYGMPVHLQAAEGGTSLVVTCGSTCVGLLAPIRVTEEEAEVAHPELRALWADRLATVVRPKP